MSERVSIDQMMKQALEIPGLLSLAAGFTDNDIMPREQILEITNELLGTDSNNDLLQYGDPSGRPGLREQIAKRVHEHDATQGNHSVEISPDEVVITNGSQQALMLAIQALCRPGDVVLVEAPTYFVFVDLLETLGVHPIPLPSRDDTLYVDALPSFFERLREEGTLAKVKAVYLVSYFSNPSALSLTQHQKDALIKAMEHAGLKVPILEDIAYREFYFDEPWPASSLVPSSTREIPTYVMGTLTKIFATGMKVGYVVIKDPRLRKRVLDLKRCHDFGTTHLLQGILQKALEDGIVDDFLEYMRPLYRDKANALDRVLREQGLAELGWSWRKSAGSLYLWLTAPADVETVPGSDFFEACMDEKVIYVPGNLCYLREGRNKVRLSFGSLDVDKLEEAGKRFVRAAQRIAQGE
jgi:2-aminoadipate transaminase